MSAQKACPYCAETIKAEAVKCRFCGTDLQGPRPQPHMAACPRCNIALVLTERKARVSIGGLLGFPIVLVGIGLLIINLIVGIFLIALGFVLSAVWRGKVVEMKCPSCGAIGARL